MGKTPQTADTERRIFTLPNAISALRLFCLFPIAAFAGRGMYGAALAVYLFCGVADVADGVIARRFGLVTRLGKILDPIADKLTGGVFLWCLCARYADLRVLFLLLAVKEVCLGAVGLFGAAALGAPYSSRLHGKISAAVFFFVLAAHAAPFLLPALLSRTLIFLSALCMELSLCLYTVRNIRVVRRASHI